MEVEQNKKNTYKIFKIISFLFIIIIVIIFVKAKNKIELTQLQDNTENQMMGYIIKTKNNKVIVIDGGQIGDANELEKNIKKQGGKVDYWFITHPHIDHMGAFIQIVNNTDIEIEKIYTTYNDILWYNEYANERPEEYKKVEIFMDTLKNLKIVGKEEKVSINQKIQIDNIKCQILGVANPEITQNATNNSSMIIKMNVNNKSIIFLGDTGSESGEKLLQNQKENLKADIVQMAHHGQNGVNEDVYKTIKPEICLWPTPKWLWENDSGQGEDSGKWKTKETRKWMKELNVKQNIIEKDGNITISVW